MNTLHRPPGCSSNSNMRPQQGVRLLRAATSRCLAHRAARGGSSSIPAATQQLLWGLLAPQPTHCSLRQRFSSLTPCAAAATQSTAIQTPQQHLGNGAPSSSGSKTTAPTFQEAIKRLQDYWASIGCIVWLPHNTEVGAGTMNPATFLRVLGPEPWNLCYAEPSIRPDDSRYGDNPNRVQRHTQFQVILKPDPGNAQELYLGSLEALGIDTHAHDIRFVEDNWESPVLGAWGLGWEVWLDGMEVTQFTYFQQAGGKVLDAPAVEITYGLERILMALQGVKHFKDVRYNDAVTYGELFMQNEYEMSCYNLDEADVQEQRQRFALFEAEAKRMLAKRLPVPAYDHLLKCSHAFNILDARGAVGVTERAEIFAAMRALAREVTGLWLARRAELEHPLGTIPALQPPMSGKPAGGPLTEPRTFVLEVGSEELPPDDVQSGMGQLRERVPALLDKLRLAYTSLEVHGTPRRLAVIVQGLAPRQAPQESKLRGPPAKAAFDAAGKPTKALEGFCKKNGVDVAAVTKEADAKGVEYCYVTVKDEGRSAAEVLTEELPALVGSLTFKKSMRWNSDTAYSRPMRWLLAMHGPVTLPASYGSLVGSNTTRVLRNAAAPEQSISSAEEYLPLLLHERITLDLEQRRSDIWAAAGAAAAEVGGSIPASSKGDLLDEVANLVESPTVIRGSFSPSFLELPQEVLIMVMRKHQRYFPVLDTAGQLLPHFITVANGPVDPAAVAAGNEAVLRARFEDATFFYKEDLKQPLEAFRPKLQGTLFQKDLGSLLDKSNRVDALVKPLAAAMGLADATDIAVAAAHLAKADLATSTVMEMTALAGTMGSHYAKKQGLDPAVAEAIFEASLPRQAGDILPKTPAGVIVAVADRLDSLVGLVAAVGAPSATADPYGLRRAAYGMLQALVSSNVQLSLSAAVDLAAAQQPIPVSDAAKASLLDFVGRRLEQLLMDGGVTPEAVRAVLAERGDNPALAAASAQQLQQELNAGADSLFRAVLTALARPTRIVKSKPVDPSLPVDPSKFEQQEERALHAAYLEAAGKLQGGGLSVSEFLAAVGPLVAPINQFFDSVFVMCEDEGVQRNRLALLRDVAAVTRGVVDLSQLPGF